MFLMLSPPYSRLHSLLYSGARSKEESIILATHGTGETRAPELRASLRLTEVSIALLPGSLVVRQTPSPSDDHVVGKNEDAKEAEGGFTEAFRLPGKSKRVEASPFARLMRLGYLNGCDCCFRPMRKGHRFPPNNLYIYFRGSQFGVGSEKTPFRASATTLVSLIRGALSCRIS